MVLCVMNYNKERKGNKMIKIKNKEEALAAVQKDGMLLEHVSYKSYEICVNAIMENPEAIQYVKDPDTTLLKLVDVVKGNNVPSKKGLCNAASERVAGDDSAINDWYDPTAGYRAKSAIHMEVGEAERVRQEQSDVALAPKKVADGCNSATIQAMLHDIPTLERTEILRYILTTGKVWNDELTNVHNDYTGIYDYVSQIHKDKVKREELIELKIYMERIYGYTEIGRRELISHFKLSPDQLRTRRVEVLNIYRGLYMLEKHYGHLVALVEQKEGK